MQTPRSADDRSSVPGLALKVPGLALKVLDRPAFSPRDCRAEHRGEAAYEWSLSLNRKEPQDRRTADWEVRKACYWDLFSGGCGYTYGFRCVTVWCRQGKSLKYGASVPCYDSLDAPGSFQVAYAHQLLGSRPFLNRIPDPTLLGDDVGQGLEHAVATRDVPATYVLVYLPTGRPITVKLGFFGGAPLRVTWFNPRDGKRTPSDQWVCCQGSSLRAAEQRRWPRLGADLGEAERFLGLHA